MTTPTEIRFDDGAAYETFMGEWSRLVGDAFLDWLAPAHGLRWADIGCGNGAFTAMLLERCAAARVEGIDPSEEQIDYARKRIGARDVTFRQGDAMALPYDDRTFDAAVMALVIFFVPDPPRGVAEMARVVRPGGSVSTYAWDIHGGGFPYAIVQQEMAALGVTPLWPPSVDASRMPALRGLWTDAGLVDLETTELRTQRTFADFDTFWSTVKLGPRLAPRLAAMPAEDVDRLRTRVRKRLTSRADGRIVVDAFANAIKGRVPA